MNATAVGAVATLVAVAAALAAIAATGGFRPAPATVSVRGSAWAAVWTDPAPQHPPVGLSQGSCFNLTGSFPAGEPFNCTLTYDYAASYYGSNISYGNCFPEMEPLCAHLTAVVVDPPFVLVSVWAQPGYCAIDRVCGEYLVTILAPPFGQSLLLSGTLVYVPSMNPI